MLKNLGQWLRVAGYDVLILPDGTADRQLVERAREEGRLLITRDRKINEFKNAGEFVILLDCNELEDCVSDLNRQLDIDWLYNPFGRCKLCNTELVEADRTAIEKVPPEARNSLTQISFCPSCKQFFWDGSHVKRMRQRLEQWNQETSL